MIEKDLKQFVQHLQDTITNTRASIESLTLSHKSTQGQVTVHDAALNAHDNILKQHTEKILGMEQLIDRKIHEATFFRDKRVDGLVFNL